MQQKFYLDTAIWRDYFEDGNDGLRPLGEFAFRFLKNCGKKKCIVLYSEAVVHELRKDYSEDKIKQVFSPFKDFLAEVGISFEQYAEARNLAKQEKNSHEADILHAIIARDNNSILVTRDAHFDCLRDIVEIRMPEEIIFD